MAELHGEIERTIRVSFTVDIAKHCALYASERATFNGSDEEFVREGIKQMAYDLLTDSQQANPDGDDGITVTEDWDETEVDFYGVVRA